MELDAEIRARREAVMREHVEAENRHDPAGVARTFARPRYDVPAMGPIGQAEGATAVEALLGGLFEAFPDWHAEAGPYHHADNAVFVEVGMTGTQRGAFAGIPPTGRRMDVRVACIFEFEGDRLVGENVYFDFATVLQQLGVLLPPA
jgi:steroid delta-isomerase-like uncharacterized protein